MPLRSYSGNAKRTALTGDITAMSTTFTVSDATGYPSPTGSEGPFVITLGMGLAGEEKMLVSSRSGNTFTISQRGFDGTTAGPHGAGRTVDHTFSATDAREANSFINAPGGYASGAGGSVITPSAIGVKGLVIKGASSQTANLLEAQSSAGAALVQVNSNGSLLVGSGPVPSFQAFAGTDVTNTTSSAFITSSIPGVRGLVVRGAASQTANLAEFQNSAGTVLAQVDKNGEINTSFALSVGALARPDANTGTYLTTGTSTVKPLVIRGASGQTANLAEFQNGAGAVLAAVTPTGRLLVQGAASQITYTGEFDGNPLGTYLGRLHVLLNGTVRYVGIYS